MGWWSLWGNLLGVRKPLNVMLSVTNRCNSRCRYCRIPSRRQDELSTDQMLTLIDQMARAGTQRLGIWGGEPLLRDDIAAIVRRAKSHGMYVTMDTNGYLLPEKIAELDGLDHAIISLDGGEAVHDANREKGSFQKVIRALRATRGRLKVWTITVLTRNNLHAIGEVLDLSKQYGFMPTFQVLHHNEHLGRNDELMPTNDEYRAAIEDILRRKRGGAMIACSRKYLEHLRSWDDYACSCAAVSRNGVRCLAGQLYCNVDTDGKVYPCSLLIGKVEGKDALSLGFEPAFRSLDPLPCQSCTAACYTEYNFLYSLDPRTTLEWISWMFRES